MINWFKNCPVPATSGTFIEILRGLLHKEQSFFFSNQFVMAMGTQALQIDLILGTASAGIAP